MIVWTKISYKYFLVIVSTHTHTHFALSPSKFAVSQHWAANASGMNSGASTCTQAIWSIFQKCIGRFKGHCARVAILLPHFLLTIAFVSFIYKSFSAATLLTLTARVDSLVLYNWPQLVEKLKFAITHIRLYIAFLSVYLCSSVIYDKWPWEYVTM